MGTVQEAVSRAVHTLRTHDDYLRERLAHALRHLAGVDHEHPQNRVLDASDQARLGELFSLRVIGQQYAGRATTGDGLYDRAVASLNDDEVFEYVEDLIYLDDQFGHAFRDAVNQLPHKCSACGQSCHN